MKLEDKDILNVGDLKRLIAEERKKQGLVKRGFLIETPEDLGEASSLRKEHHAFKAVFLFGPAGSGKTFISNQVGLPKIEDGNKGFSTVNPDQRIEDVFPSFGVTMKFASGEGNEDLEKLQQGMRGILQNASQAHTHNLITRAKPLIFDTTGEDVPKMTKRIKALQEIGYAVGVLMVNVPPDVSVDRDNNRARTVGADRTMKISTDYQEFVVQQRGYFKSLKGTGALIFGGDIYPNLYKLGKTPTLLDGITEEHVKAMGSPTPEGAQKLLDKIRRDSSMFLSADYPLPAHGESIKRAMLRLIDITGRYGQNMLDVERYWSQAFREEYPETVGDKHIEEASEYLAWLGGAGKSIKNANRSRKNTGDDTIRDMTGNKNPAKMGQSVPGTDTEENPQGRNRRWQESEQKLVSDIIREAVLQIKKDLGE